MKIIFVCGSLEPGLDGVGDYTRNLALECKSYGVSCVLVSINDKYIYNIKRDIIDDMSFYRIPNRISWKQKGEELNKILMDNSPFSWISVQYVSYSFNNKGIVWNIFPLFKILKRYNVHVMVHELWVGVSKNESLKMHFLGFIQKKIILLSIKKLKPRIIQTSIPLYRKILAINNVKSTILPLFSNIKYHECYRSEFYEQIPNDLLENHNRSIIGCVFGSIYYKCWDLVCLFDILKQESNSTGKQIVIVSVGKIGFGEDFWLGLPTKYPDINFITLGQKDECFISYWLRNFVDFGIVTAPALMVGKSGSCMAFLEHGVPVFCKKNDLSFTFKISKDMFDDRVIQISKEDAFNLPAHNPPFFQLKDTAQKFIKVLNDSYQQ